MPETSAATELASRREALTRAQEAIRALLRAHSGPAETSQILEDVAKSTGLDVVVVQRALWKLVHDGALDLTDTLDVQEG